MLSTSVQRHRLEAEIENKKKAKDQAARDRYLARLDRGTVARRAAQPAANTVSPPTHEEFASHFTRAGREACRGGAPLFEGLMGPEGGPAKPLAEATDYGLKVGYKAYSVVRCGSVSEEERAAGATAFAEDHYRVALDVCGTFGLANATIDSVAAATEIVPREDGTVALVSTMYTRCEPDTSSAPPLPTSM